MINSITQVSWNVNSIRLRFEQLIKVVEELTPDIICLQELKCQKHLFPAEEFSKLGYKYHAANVDKSRGGVAIISKHKIDSSFSVNLAGKDDCRHVSASILGIEFHNFYVPAGGYEADIKLNEKFAYKLKYLEEMEKWFIKNRNNTNVPMSLCGDLNVAPHENDVWSHKAMLKTVSHTPDEIIRLNKVKNSLEWFDILRETVDDNIKLYTWWTYRQPDWKTSNKGRRLDHIWLSQNLKTRYNFSGILKEARDWERPSDHVPIYVNFNIFI